MRGYKFILLLKTRMKSKCVKKIDRVPILRCDTQYFRVNHDQTSVLKTGKLVTKVCDEVNRWAISFPFELLFL